MSDDEQRRPPEAEQPTRSEKGNPPEPASDAAILYERLGDFELLREIGRGGMGVVYEARQISLKRRVALKVLPPGLGLTGQAVQRFEREAQAAGKLHHTNIVPVYATGEDRGAHYYAMELIEGQPLSRVLEDLGVKRSNPLMEETVTKVMEGGAEIRSEERSPVEPSTSLSDTDTGGRRWFDTVAKLMADVAEALHYAHDRGVIHRDVKPANLLLSHDGRLCIGDFGLARVAQEPGMTVSGSFLGTPAYMSPEQVAAGRVKLDHRTDVYSLGAVLYEMLTLQRPFGGDSREQILTGILSKEPRPPRRINPRVPLDLETICLKAMEKDPDRRYATAAEMAADLRQYLQRGLIAARRAGPIRRFGKAVRRHPVVATVVAAALVVVVASVVAWQAGGRAEVAQRLVADARLALREGTYRNGLRLVDRALALDPDSLEAKLVRARLLLMSFHVYEAAEVARSVLDTDPQNLGAHTLLVSAALFPVKGEVTGRMSLSAEDHRLGSIDPELHVRAVEAAAPESAEAFYVRALKATDMRQQIELLDRALDRNPGDPLASLAKMIALGHLMDHGLVLAEADRLITARPKSAQGWRMKADAYRQQRNFERARAAIARALEVDDRDPRNYLQRARIHRDRGEKGEALSDLARAIELDPSQGFLYQERADLLVGMGRYEEAIADARKTRELNPDHPGAWNALVASYFSLGQMDRLRALNDEMRSMVNGWPDSVMKGDAIDAIVGIDAATGETDRALDGLDRAIELADPDWRWMPLFQRSEIRQRLGDLEGAKSDCEEAVRAEVKSPLWLAVRGVWLLSRPGACIVDTGRALDDFDRAIGLAPNWSFAYSWRGETHMWLQKSEQALADFDRAIELSPYFAWPHFSRARLYFDEGRLDEALAGFAKALELDPYDAEMRQQYGHLLFAMGRLEEGLAAFDEALELIPALAVAHAGRGQVLARLGRCDEAAGEVRRASELAGQGVALQGQWVHNGIAEVHLKLFYYDCPDHYDLDEALRHAEMIATESSMQQTRALALLRSGDYAEAKRIYLEAAGDEHDGAQFPLAICLWHLGERADARRVFDRSVAWMDERLPDNPNWIGLRKEAAELLGVEP